MISLETNRLILRPYDENDLDDYHQLMSDKDNLYFLNDIATETMDESRISLSETMTLNRSGQARRFCMVLKERGTFMGAVGYDIIEVTPLGKIADPMGWFIMPAYQRKGYVTEAVKRVLAFAFLQDNCVRIATGCFADNIPTQKVMAKTGFRKEAEKVKARYHDGVMKDRLEFAINKDEYKCE